MKLTSYRRAIVPGVAALAIALSACSAGNEGDSDSGSASEGEALSGTLQGGGASSQEKAQNAWVAGIQDANPDLTVNYEPVGSGDGRANFISGGYAFAGTDSALNDDEGELTSATETCGGESPIQVPAYVSPIAIVYNLPGVDELHLDAATASDIFAGKIKTWDDPKIAALNEGVELPSTNISPVHRSDDSGTQENFTAYLAEAGTWAEEPEGVWPAKLGGEGADGTSGVVGAVQAGEGTIGFVDHSAAVAADLTQVSVKVGEEFVEPSAEGAAAVLGVSESAGLTDTDMAVELARDTTEAGVYPVVLVSYLLACQTYDDAETADLVKGYLTYVLSPEGQEAAAAEAGSAPLAEETASEAQGLIDGISATE
ncbi:phosphate ABC transporter substrate-binding protein PstS [Nocardioides insulae]|uniref:phosphate ABC transporter substrate-binding protein PstS n=1 Tax=Nocardioides insulae TaxID=394734 RepID=UPI00041BD5A1|nr:phosphate ABC transporter substrate-binding protein PstS [Nocardioides insulae]